jgi:K(+)-stimulated pyrophosphate-energized sodium pump
METIANTTVALGNGFSSGTSLISTISLFLVSLQFLPQGEGLFESFQLLHISGLLIGLTMPYIVGNTLLTSLRHTIKNTVSEVVRQFKEIPFLIEKKAKPDMIRASDLTTFYTMNALILPGIIMILCPLTLGFIFGPEMIITLSIGCILTAYQQSFDWSNLGDSLHNAKNHIESGHFGGKNSPNFQHIRPIEKIGIMYKDLLSPSNNILIKTLTIVGLLVIISLNL